MADPGKPKEQLFKRVTLDVKISQPVRDYVLKALDAGLVGQNKAQAVERLLSESIQRLLASGALTPFTAAEIDAMRQEGGPDKA